MKFEHNTLIDEVVNPFGKEFCKFPRKGEFFQEKKIFQVLELQATITPQQLPPHHNHFTALFPGPSR